MIRKKSKKNFEKTQNKIIYFTETEKHYSENRLKIIDFVQT